MKSLIPRLIEYLITEHNCHTIILYGSLARGDMTAVSDIDVLGIKQKGEAYRIGKEWNGSLLDAWIYSEENLPKPENLVHLKDSIVLKEDQIYQLGTNLITSIRSILSKPPPPMPRWERQLTTTWITKTIARSKQCDVEGNYRRHWLLIELLPCWFKFQGKHYFGVKESMAWLEQNEPDMHLLFSNALTPSAPIEAIEFLADKVIKSANLNYNFTIRPAKLSDITGIAKVHVDCWRTTYEGIVPQSHLDQLSYDKREEVWTRILTEAQPRHHLFVAEDESKRIIGFIDGGINRTPHIATFEGEINALYLLKEFQNIGIGKRLFEKSIQQFRQDKFKSIVVWVLADNPTTKFYARMGGRIVGEKMIEIGGKQLKELAYVWDHLNFVTT